MKQSKNTTTREAVHSLERSVQIIDRRFMEEFTNINQKLDEIMIMMAKWYQVSLPTELLSKEYSNLIIQRKVQDVQKVDLKE